MRQLPLHPTGFALVDDEDFEDVSRFKWYYYPRRYVQRPYRVGPGRAGLRTESLHRRLLSVNDPNEEVDHIDGNRLNNTRANLRRCSHANNAKNVPGRPGSSRFKGVSWNTSRRKWAAYVRLNGRSKCLGRFDSEEEAARAYDRAAALQYGEFARLNFANAS